MYCRACVALAIAAFSLLFLGGCSRNSRRVERLTIPPFENLTDDPSLDWAGMAISEAIVTQLAGSSVVCPLPVASVHAASSEDATDTLRGYFTAGGSRFLLKVERENLDSRRVVETYNVQDDVLGIADALAHRIDPKAQPYETRNGEALKKLAEGRAAVDPAIAAEAFERAISLDPDYGASYVALAQLKLIRGDRDGCRDVLARAHTRGNRIMEMRRAELDLLSASLNNDPAARQSALTALSRLRPTDADVLRQLAVLETSAHHFDQAAQLYRKAASADPFNGPTWNQLGYVEAYRRDLREARTALLEYARLAPRDANPIDSLGEVHYYLGEFRDAEQYFLQAYDRDPAFLGGSELYKAARARLMTGDVGGADQIFRRYADARKAAKDPLLPYRESQWLSLTGRSPAPAAVTNGPADANLAAVYKLLDARRFAEAVPPLQGFLARTDPLAPEQFNILLAWALVETGRTQEAAPLLETYGVPAAGFEGPLIRLTFPRVFLLKAQVLDAQGKRQQASEFREIYKKLSGPTGGQ